MDGRCPATSRRAAGRLRRRPQPPPRGGHRAPRLATAAGRDRPARPGAARHVQRDGRAVLRSSGRPQGDPLPHLRRADAPLRHEHQPAADVTGPQPCVRRGTPPQAASSPRPIAAARPPPGPRRGEGRRASPTPPMSATTRRERDRSRTAGIHPPRRRASAARRARSTAAACRSVASVPTKSSTTSAGPPSASVQAAGSSADRPISAPSVHRVGQALWRLLADPDDQVAAGIRHHAQVLDRELAERPRTRSAAPGHRAPAMGRRGGRRGRA